MQQPPGDGEAAGLSLEPPLPDPPLGLELGLPGPLVSLAVLPLLDEPPLLPEPLPDVFCCPLEVEEAEAEESTLPLESAGTLVLPEELTSPDAWMVPPLPPPSLAEPATVRSANQPLTIAANIPTGWLWRMHDLPWCPCACWPPPPPAECLNETICHTMQQTSCKRARADSHMHGVQFPRRLPAHVAPWRT